MKLWDALLSAAAAVLANRLRSALTILGVVIGVSAVISLMSIGKGAEAAIVSQIESMGSNLLFIRPGATTSQMGVRAGQGSASTLTLDDAYALADSGNYISMVAPEISTAAQVTAGGQNMFTRIAGVTPEYQWVRNFPVEEGEFIASRDLEARSTVAVLGNHVAETLFGGGNAVGQTVRLQGVAFRVIGVLKAKGGAALGMEDDLIAVPLTTLQYRLASQRNPRGLSIQVIYAQANGSDKMVVAKEEAASILRERHRTSEDDFTITTQEEMLSARSQVTEVLTLFLGAIAGISLLVGGIGIMNIMLVSVTERTREIGIRKAVGAKRKDILLQFLLEASFLSFSGGLLGVGAGWGISRLINHVPIAGQQLTTAISLDVVILALSVAMAIGLFFGIYPASRAARLNPIEALRHE